MATYGVNDAVDTSSTDAGTLEYALTNADSGDTIDFQISANFQVSAEYALPSGILTFDTQSNNDTIGGSAFADPSRGSAGLTKVGPGNLVLTSNNTYSGGTIVSSGTLQIGDGSSTGSVQGDIVDNATLAFDPGVTGGTFLGDISGSGLVNKTGAYTETLSGALTNVALIVNGGSLSLSENAQLISAGVNPGNGGDSVAVVVTAGSTLFNHGRITQNNNYGDGDGVQLNGGTLINTGLITGAHASGIYVPNGTILNTGSISGAYGIYVRNSLNGFKLSGDGSIIGTGADGIYYAYSQGNVTLGTSDAALGAVSGFTNGIEASTGDGSRIDIVTGGTVAGQTGDGIAASAFGPSTVSMTVEGAVTGADDGIALYSESNTSSVAVASSSSVSGAIGLWFGGRGTSTLMNDGAISSTAQGGNALQIDDGTLVIGDSFGTMTGRIGLTNSGAKLDLEPTTTLTVANIIAGTGSLTMSGSGTLILTGADTYTGATTIASGKLQIGRGGNAGSIQSTTAILDQGVLATNESGTVVVAAAISGSGSVVAGGSGTTLLQAANSYTGGTTIETSATLELATVTSAGTGLITYGLGEQTLQVDAALANGSTFANTLANMQSGDAIDLRALGFTAGATASVSGSTLVVTSNGTSNSFTLSDAASSDFVARSDGHGGTLITELRAIPVTNGSASGDGGFSSSPVNPTTPGPDNVMGTSGADTIAGLGGDDTIGGGSGDDLILGNQGNDLITDDDGNNTIAGGMDNDRIAVGNGANLLYGDEGADTISAGNGGNTIVGGTGNRAIDSLDGADLITSGSGNDLILGNGGDDTVGAGAGNDTVSGGFGNDVLLGNQGDDIVLGNQGNDVIYGGFGDDTLFGGQGDDTLIGGQGNDVLYGNEGANRFVFNPGETNFLSGTGTGDTVMDFKSGTDSLHFASGPAGTAQNFGSASTTASNFAQAQAVAQTLLNGGDTYAFVGTESDGYLFTTAGNGGGTRIEDVVNLTGVKQMQANDIV